MKMFIGIALVAGCLHTASAAPASDIGTTYFGLVSDLQAMAGGTYTVREWGAIEERLDRLIESAEARGEANWAVEARLVKARVHSEMRRQHDEALRELDAIRHAYEGRDDVPAMKKVFVTEAAVYSRKGDASAVNRVIREFKNSPHYDSEEYDFSGGFGPNDPLVVQRPNAMGAESISVTAMEVLRTQARYSPGQPFPEFQVTDTAGNVHRLGDYQGKVLLVDFWHSGWTNWKRDLPVLKASYKAHHREGLEVLGICLERDRSAAAAFAEANGITWPLVYGEFDLAHQLGIFGEASNVLVGPGGIILARNLHEGDLSAAIRSALER